MGQSSFARKKMQKEEHIKTSLARIDRAKVSCTTLYRERSKVLPSQTAVHQQISSESQRPCTTLSKTLLILKTIRATATTNRCSYRKEAAKHSCSTKGRPRRQTNALRNRNTSVPRGLVATEESAKGSSNSTT